MEHILTEIKNIVSAPVEIFHEDTGDCDINSLKTLVAEQKINQIIDILLKNRLVEGEKTRIFPEFTS